MSFVTRLRGSAIALFLGPVGQRIVRFARHLRHGGLPGRGGIEVYHDPSDPISHLLLVHLRRMLPELNVAGQLFVVSRPAADVDPAPADRRAYRLLEAERIARAHNLPFERTVDAPREDAVARVKGVLAIARPFADHLDLAIRTGELLWADDIGLLEAVLAGRQTTLPTADPRVRKRGFYAGSAIYHRGAWFPDFDRWPHLEAELRGVVVAPLALPHIDAPADPPATVDLFFSFRSPYSYLALERVFALAERTGAHLRVRPVLPMVMRNLAVPRVKRLYFAQDAAREARRHGIPYGRIADPLGVGVERCIAIVHHVTDPTLRTAFIRIAARGIWAEALDVADDTDLRVLTDRAGIGWNTVQAALSDDSWRQTEAENQAALRASGAWGVPTFVVGKHVIWGQDRLDVLAELLIHPPADE